MCIVWWKLGCLCMVVCLCPSHLISVIIPCLECVHASEHVFMFTWLPMLAKPPMDSYMESGYPYVTLYVCPSRCFWSHTLIKMSTCISTYIQVHLTPEVCSTPLHSYMETWVPRVLLYGTVYMSQSPHFSSNTLFRMHTFISTCSYVHTGSKFLCTLLCIVTWKHGFPCVKHCVCSSQSTSVPIPCLECAHASVHVFVLTWLPILAKPPPYG